MVTDPFNGGATFTARRVADIDGPACQTRSVHLGLSSRIARLNATCAGVDTRADYQAIGGQGA
jgi:hypothetical protein